METDVTWGLGGGGGGCRTAVSLTGVAGGLRGSSTVCEEVDIIKRGIVGAWGNVIKGLDGADTRFFL